MALDLNLRVSKDDFQKCIDTAELKMASLMDVIERYNDAKRNLNQFIDEDDINYQAMIERIDENIRAARKSYNALKLQKNTLQETVTKMETMGSNVKQTIEAATGAVGSIINAALQVEDVL